jgi:hypothetical protein
MNVHFLSASDRLNYGDLLFPLIFEETVIKNTNINFYNYGLVKSDLTAFGALKTESFKKLETRIKNGSNGINIIVIGGGHSMFPTWSTLYSHISTVYNKLIKFIVIKKLFHKINIPKILLTSTSSISPFAPLLEVKVIYNSVGGSVTENIDDKTLDLLKNSPALNVRDEYLFSRLKKLNLNPNLVPDTATIMEDIWPLDKLSKLVSKECKAFSNRKYVFVQLGLNKAPSDTKKFVSDLQFFLDKDYEILCSPIGIAQGHEDTVELKKLINLNSEFKFYYPKNLFETMFLIGNSSTYLGTSLHGCITAFAFNIPFIPINEEVKKLKNYAYTWWTEFLPGIVSFEELSDFLNTKHINYSKSKAFAKLEKDKKLVYKQFTEIKSHLENET